MIDRFEILNFNSPRPNAERIIFCDGTGGDWFNADTDLELSHWRPNSTPAEYRAGSSTEICFRFLDNPRPGSWTAAVNNHVDVDGILSVYVLVKSGNALANRQTIIEAADMGDFWGWGKRPAQRVFQGLTQLTDTGRDPQQIYAEAFRRIPGLIDGSDPAVPEIEDSLAPLRHGVDLVEHGQITRTQKNARFTHYVVPSTAAGKDEQATYVPEFNEAISPKRILWPQVLARWDSERLCLVSTERENGWFHDLWFPGYLWADTEGKWRPPEMAHEDGMSGYRLRNDGLIAAVEELQGHEIASGYWALGGTSLPFGDELEKLLPLVGRFLDRQGRPAASQLSLDRVVKTLQGIYS